MAEPQPYSIQCASLLPPEAGEGLGVVHSLWACLLGTGTNVTSPHSRHKYTHTQPSIYLGSWFGPHTT